MVITAKKYTLLPRCCHECRYGVGTFVTRHACWLALRVNAGYAIARYRWAHTTLVQWGNSFVTPVNAERC